MDLSSIGKHLKERLIQKSWTQEEVAERLNLSPAYIGMIERGEKVPRLETFIRIINELGMSADVALEDVTNIGYQVRMSRYIDKIEGLPKEKQKQVYEVLDVMLKGK